MEGGLTALVTRLREQGFRAGPAEAIAAARVLQVLGQQPEAPTQPQAWRLWLRPVFCSNREEQQRFDPVFNAWAAALAREAVRGGGSAAGPAPPPPAPPPWWQRWLQRLQADPSLWAVPLTLLLAASYWWFDRDHAQGPLVSTPVPSASAPAAAASRPVPPQRAASAVLPAAGSTTALVAQASTALAPAWRSARTLRAEVVLPLLLGPWLLAWLLGGVPPLALMRGLRRSPHAVTLDTQELEAQARALLPGLEPGVAGRLERHLRADPESAAGASRRRRIDERRTVEGLLRRPGWLHLRHRAAPLRPAYLVLVDCEDEADPRGRLFVHWAERLRREGLVVEIRTFRGRQDAEAALQAPATRPLQWQPGQPEQALDQLPDPPVGQRLVVVSDARAWVDAQAQWHPWLDRARLHRWPERVFFTPTELRDWGAREAALEEPENTSDRGFLTLPMDEAALAAWSVRLASGELPRFALSEPQHYPRLLSRAGFDPFAEPPEDQREQLVAQLMLYLGDAGFRWLCMLAVPPLVRWELTLRLGQALLDALPGVAATEAPLLLSRNYRLLSRLPWLRGQRLDDGSLRAAYLPDWLRLRLHDELPAAVAADVRARAEALLAQVKQGPGSLSLGFEAPPRSGRGIGGAPARARAEPVDTLYLGLISGLTPRQLAQRVPQAWQGWLRPRSRQPGLAGAWWRLRQWLAARWSRIVFRDGLPWAERQQGVWWFAGLTCAVLVFALVRLSDAAPWQLPTGLEATLFRTRAVALELPVVARSGVLSADGRRAALLAAGGQVVLTDADSTQVLQQLDGADQADELRFDAQGLLACQGQTTVRSWSWTVPATQLMLRPSEDGNRACDGPTSDGRPSAARALAQASADLRAVGELPPQVAAYGSGRGVFVTGDRDGQLGAWWRDPANPAVPARALAGQHLGSLPLRALSVDADANRVLSVAGDGLVRISQFLQPPEGRTRHDAVAVAISADGQLLATLASDGQLHLQWPDQQRDDLTLQLPGLTLGSAAAPTISVHPTGQEVAVLVGGQAWIGKAVGPTLPLQQLLEFKSEPQAVVLALRHASNGELVAVDSAGGIGRWDGKQWRSQALALRGPLAKAWIAPSGAVAAVAEVSPQQQFVHWRDAAGQGESALRTVSLEDARFPPFFGSMGRSLWWLDGSKTVGIHLPSNYLIVKPKAAWAAGGPWRAKAYDDDSGLFAVLDADSHLAEVALSGSEVQRPSTTLVVDEVRALPGARWLLLHASNVATVEPQGWPVVPSSLWPAMPLNRASGLNAALDAQGRRLVFATRKLVTVSPPLPPPAAPVDVKALVERLAKADPAQVARRLNEQQRANRSLRRDVPDAALWYALPPAERAWPVRRLVTGNAGTPLLPMLLSLLVALLALQALLRWRSTRRVMRVAMP